MIFSILSFNLDIHIVFGVLMVTIGQYHKLNSTAHLSRSNVTCHELLHRPVLMFSAVVFESHKNANSVLALVFLSLQKL